MATPAPVPTSSTQAATSVPGQRHKWRRQHRIGDGPRNQQAGPGPQDQLSGGTDVIGPAQPVSDTSLTMRPASVTPTSQSQSIEASSAGVPAAGNGQSRRRRNQPGRGGAMEHHRRDEANSNKAGRESSHAGQGLRHARGAGSMITMQRQFGGHLTTGVNTDAPSLPTAPLQANAPEFHPGQQYVHQSKSDHKRRVIPPPKANTRIPRLRRGSSLKSTAPDIATRTHEDISNGVYECPICTSE
ncbi:MAG: FKBP12-associated protein, partial [Pleopsidium flavum]